MLQCPAGADVESCSTGSSAPEDDSLKPVAVPVFCFLRLPGAWTPCMPASPTHAGGTAARAWLLALAGITLAAFNLRTAVTSITPLLDVVGREFGFGATMAGVIGMLPAAAFAIFGAATPALARRIGLERTVLLAMALAAAGLVLRSVAGNMTMLIAGSLVSLAGMGIGNVVL